VEKPKYIITDTHLKLNELFKPFERYFRTVKDYNDTFIKNWNSVVRDTDIVVHLGDVGDRDAIEEIFPKLKGRKWLVLGNHDKLPKSFYEKYFEQVFPKKVSISKRIVLSHIPTKVDDDEINLHGHTHEIILKSKNHINMCQEIQGFKPISIKRFERLLGDMPKISIKFLEEWYKDIQIPTILREDIVLKKGGTIDVEMTKIFREYKKQIEEIDSEGE